MQELTQKQKIELEEAFKGRFQSPFYADSIELVVPAGDSDSLDLKIPSGSEFIPEGLNIEYEAEDDGTCELFATLESSNNQRVYIGSAMRVSLLATPGRSTNGVRFGSLPWRGAIPGEDGITVKVVNNGSEARRISFAWYGKRYVKLSESQVNRLKNGSL